jgi:hypothetical protein
VVPYNFCFMKIIVAGLYMNMKKANFGAIPCRIPQQGPPPNPRQSWCSLGNPFLILGGWVHLYGRTALFPPSLAQKKKISVSGLGRPPRSELRSSGPLFWVVP